MKKVFTMVLTMGVLLASAQTVINETWSRVTGYPNPNFNWSASDTDAGNNVINAGNTLGAGSQLLNMHIVKLDDADGSVLWEEEWTSQGSYNDYASDVVVGSDAVYVCGASVISSTDVVCVILKLDLDDGELLWTYTYNTGLINIPSSIEYVSSDGIYFCGSTTSVSTSSDFMVGHLYDSDGLEDWTQTYDYSQDYDLGVRMRVNSQTVYVTGVSGSSWTDTEITTLAFNKFSGSLVGVNNIPNPSDYIDMPTDITTDIAGNVYICGQYGTGTSCDMKVVKLDDELEMLWEVEWDGNDDEDVPNALAVDEEGNVYATGYTINEDNKKEMVTNAFDDAGELLWSKRKLVKPLYQSTCGTDIDYRFGQLIAACTYKANDATHQLLYSYKTDDGFPNWIEEFDDFALNDTTKVQVRIMNNNAAYTTAMTDGSEGFRYLNVRYDFKKRNRVPHYDENDKPDYAAHEVFIRFVPDALNYSTLDNTNKHYGKL
ncbi:MAG: SBBP repeat-containing protein, partial [Flavobacteriales bacterium]